MRITVTGGGSGGHISPALAVIEKLKQKSSHENKPLQILYIGGKLGMEGTKEPSLEQKILPQTDIPHVFIHAGKLQRSFSLRTPFLLGGVIPGFFEALYHLIKFKPDVIFSTGGFVTVPVVFSGWLLRIPIVVHEQTAVVGLANKIGGFFAKTIAVSFPSSIKEFPPKKVVATGNPIRSEILAAREVRKQPPTTHHPPPTIYITGGAQGSHIINETIKNALPELLKRVKIIHQCGSSPIYRDFEALINTARKLPDELSKRYEVLEYVGQGRIGDVFVKTDLVVARAGANTVNELAVLGIPAIFIPIPWVTNNEQYKNARILVNAGSATIIPENELTAEKLLNEIEEMIKNLDELNKKAKEFQKEVKVDAAEKLAEIIWSISSVKTRS
ncbi:MAG: undecaprenyldiphospho-muramoylpentapeptide beta-N-acetylglucosaminyltransferase [Candidatus Cloacimonetes bacterium]|nr:undecaprenyldiphospho-muramoylpentapeptide beta-N-acetylglucosaminyltransferase [Candidatus Cloacimonadota bacterium]